MKALALIEHVDRELDLVCLLKHLLKDRHDIDLDIANFYADEPLTLAGEAPRAVLVPFCYGADDYVMRDYFAMWPATHFINLAWEQVFYPSHQTIKKPRDAFARERAVHVAWSRAFVDYMRENGVEPANMKLVGHALYGLYRGPYTQYFKPRDELASALGLDPAKRWVFVPENYRWAFFNDSKLKRLSRRGITKADLHEMREYCRRSLAALMDWCDSLAGRGDVEVILRPRPATSVAELRRFAGTALSSANPAFRIIKDESAREWVLASDVVVSSYSTVLIEAALAGRSIFRIATEPLPEGLHYAWCDLVPSAAREDAFIAASLIEDNGASAEPLRTWATETFFPSGDPIDALVETVATEIREAHRGPPRRKSWRNPVRMPRWLKRSARDMSPQERHHMFQKHVRNYTFTAETHDKDLFGAADVEQRVSRWREMLADEARATGAQRAGLAG